MFVDMSKFLYLKFKDQHNNEERAASHLAGQSDRSLSVLSHNIYYRTSSIESNVSGNFVVVEQDKKKGGCC